MFIQTILSDNELCDFEGLDSEAEARASSVLGRDLWLYPFARKAVTEAWCYRAKTEIPFKVMMYVTTDQRLHDASTNCMC